MGGPGICKVISSDIRAAHGLFTAINLASGVSQLPIAEDYRLKTSFCDAYGQRWEYVGCGLTLLEPQSRCEDKPVEFQVLCPQNVTAVLKGLRGKGVECYSDDIPIYCQYFN